MKSLKFLAAGLLCTSALTGCDLFDGGSGDTIEPEAQIVFPTRAGVTGADSFNIRGTAGDNHGVSRVEVNGLLADTDDNYETWTATVELEPGTNVLSVDVTDLSGNVARGAAEVAITRRLEIMRPFGYELDATTDTLYFVDLEQQKIMTVALATGEVDEFADLAQFEPTGTVVRPPIDLALDLANDRVFLTVRGDEAVGDSSVGVWKYDVTAQTWSAFSDSTIDSNAMLTNPSDILFDGANNRLLVLGWDLDAVVEVDLTTGAQSVLASNTVPNNSHSFLAEPIDAAYDSASNRIVLVDRSADAVVSIDLTTGAKTLISGQGAGSGVALNQPLSIALDTAGNRALIFDRGTRSVIAVDLATGIRSTFADNAGVQDGQWLFDVRSLVVSDGELIALDALMDHALGLALDTGARRVITNNGFPRGSSPPSLSSLQKIGGAFFGQTYTAIGKIAADNSVEILAGSLDQSSTFAINNMTTNSSGSMAYTAEYQLVNNVWEQKLNAVDLSDGTAAVLSDSTTPDANNLWTGIRDMVADDANNRVIVLGNDNIFAVDMTTGARSILSDDPSMAFVHPHRMALDESGGRLLVADTTYDHLIAVDMTTGARSAFATAAVPGESDPEDLWMVAVTDDGVVWAMDDEDRLLKIDAQTGARSIFVDVNELNELTGDYWYEIFSTGGYLYGRAYSGILEIDTDSGEMLKIFVTPPSSPGNST